jgi:response regulator RpfG family c-di-GMP phosphodiesterase
MLAALDRVDDEPEALHAGADGFIGSIFRASLLHDMGSVAINDEIPIQPAKLTTEEFETIAEISLRFANENVSPVGA